MARNRSLPSPYTPVLDRADGDDRVLIHTYPAPGGRAPRVGDKAYCGHIKVNPLKVEAYPPEKRLRCVVCAELKELWG